MWACVHKAAAHRALHIDQMHLGALLTCSIAFLGGGLPGRPRPWRGTPTGFAARRSGSYRGCGWKAAQSVMRGGAPQRIWCATAGSDAGLPSEAATAAHASAQAESRLANMAEDWQTVSRDLATAAASFKPSRFSMIDRLWSTDPGALLHTICSACRRSSSRARQSFQCWTFHVLFDSCQMLTSGKRYSSGAFPPETNM